MNKILTEIKAAYRDLSAYKRRQARQAIQAVLGLEAEIRFGILCRLGGMEMDSGAVWTRYEEAARDLVALLRLLWKPSGWAPLSVGFDAESRISVAKREDLEGAERLTFRLADLCPRALDPIDRPLTAHERVLYSAAIAGALRNAAMSFSGRCQIERAVMRSARGEVLCARQATSVFWGKVKALRPRWGRWQEGHLHLQIGDGSPLVCAPAESLRPSA